MRIRRHFCYIYISSVVLRPFDLS